jgi:tetratricopeptide (TPR) repeat protein
MSRRRRSDADLPKAPLELAHPMTVPGSAVAGAEVAADVTGPYATMLFRVYRLVLAWTTRAKSDADPDALRRLEQTLLERMDHDELAAPLALLVALVQSPDPDADRSRAAWACMCLAEWAIEQGARRTAIAFTQLAALIAPRNSRYAWLAARLVFAEGDLRDAVPWYRRAHRIAVWTDDWEGQARALNSLGLSYFERGKYPSARRHYHQAIKVAQRRNLRHMEGMTAHNLLVLHSATREFDSAEHYAIRTFELYGPTHPRLAMLIGDIAIFWIEQGCYHRAIPILRALERWSTQPEDRIRIACQLARSGGGIGDREMFFAGWDEVNELAKIDFGSALAAEALYECGVGAASLGEIHLARSALTRAMDGAARHGAARVATNAELALKKLARGEEIQSSDTRAAHDSPEPSDVFARSLLRALNPVYSSNPR